MGGDKSVGYVGALGSQRSSRVTLENDGELLWAGIVKGSTEGERFTRVIEESL